MNRRDILVRLLRDRRDTDPDNPYVLFVGAGASLSSGASLFSRVFHAVGASSYDEFSSVVESLSDTERHALLSSYIQLTSPSSAALRLAQLVRDGYFSLVMTTNFDNLLEKSLQETGLGPDDYIVLVNDRKSPLERLQTLLSHPTPRIKIVKLHGDVSRRAYALTHRETIEFAKPVEDALRQLFRDRDLLLIGTRFADLDLLRVVPSEGDGSIWYVNPSKPEGHFLGVMQARRCEANLIDGDDGRFDPFMESLFAALNRDTHARLEGTWWLLAPCFLSSNPRHGIGEQSADRESGHLLLQFQNGEDRAELHWFDGGLAVWCLSLDVSYPDVFEFSIARRRAYRALLRGEHWLATRTNHILELLVNEETPAALPVTGIGYVLSMIELRSGIWSEKLRAHGLKLLSCPSLLDDSAMENERDDLDPDAPSPERASELRRKEAQFLRAGVPDGDHCCFTVGGLMEGYASWAGVAWHPLSVGAERTRNALLKYEIELQACWWYLHHVKSCAEKGLVKQAKEHIERTRIAARVSRLLTIGPTEHTSARRFREAIIESSRIGQLWQDARSLTDVR